MGAKLPKACTVCGTKDLGNGALLLDAKGKVMEALCAYDMATIFAAITTGTMKAVN